MFDFQRMIDALDLASDTLTDPNESIACDGPDRVKEMFTVLDEENECFLPAGWTLKLDGIGQTLDDQLSAGDYRGAAERLTKAADLLRGIKGGIEDADNSGCIIPTKNMKGGR